MGWGAVCCVPVLVALFPVFDVCGSVLNVVLVVIGGRFWRGIGSASELRRRCCEVVDGLRVVLAGCRLWCLALLTVCGC